MISSGIRIFILLMFSSMSLFSQRYVDVLKLQYQGFQPNGLGISSSTTYMHDLSASLFLPIELKSKNILVTGINYSRYDLLSQNKKYSNESLTSLSLNAGGIWKWKDGQWSIMVLALPKLASDMNDATLQHMQFGGLSLFTFVKNKRLKYKFGVYYNREFFGNFIMPLAGIEYGFSDKFILSVLAPRSLHAEYKIHPKWYAGLAHKSIVASYMLSDNNGQNYLREGHQFWGNRQTKVFLDYYPFKSLVLYGELGFTTGRTFGVHDSFLKEEVEDHQLTNVNPIYSDISNTTFFNFGIAFRKRLD